MTGASYHKGSSEQIVCTPEDFLAAVTARFWSFDFDLAATRDNAITSKYFGPRSTLGENSLVADWPDKGIMWLNPPFFNLKPWVSKCSKYKSGGKIFLLIPASVGSNWWAEFVHDRSFVIFLRPRLTFVGSITPYPRDLALCVYRYGATGYQTWKWK